MLAMKMFDIFFLQEHSFWIACAISAIIAVSAGYAERRRGKRKNIEAVGFMPWITIMLLAGIGAFVFLLYALALGQGIAS